MRQCMDAENLHRRLKKIIGQVQAIDRMVDEDVPCEDVLAQINAAKNDGGPCDIKGKRLHIRQTAYDSNAGDNQQRYILFDASQLQQMFQLLHECFHNDPLFITIQGIGI